MALKITFQGENKKLSDDVFRLAIKFMLEHLLPKRTISRLKLSISFDPKDNMVNAIGYCCDFSSKNYFIWIRPTRERKKQLETLAHELVHIKQFETNEICASTGNMKTSWMRTLSKNISKCVPKKEIDAYWDSPPEIEACGRAVGLCIRFLNHCDDKNINYW